MAIWFELIVMLLVTYAAGLTIGFLVWGRDASPPTDEEEEDSTP